MRHGSGGRKSRSATLADVARLAGVSPSTVSRVINEPMLVRGDTSAAVQRAIAQIGYVPNILAGGLASNRTNLVAVVVPTIANSIFADTVQALTAALTLEGYQVLVGITDYDMEKEDDLLRAIIGRRPDGLVLTGTVHSNETRAMLLGASIPIVETWDVSPTPLDMAVGFSHPAAGRAIATHLLAKGYRRFGLLFSSDQRALLRLEALKEIIADSGCPAPCVTLVPPANNISYGRRGLGELFAADQGIDAVVCSSDALALGVISEARERGMAIPSSFAVMGFGDLDFSEFTSPSLSTVRVDRTQIGHEAASAILARLRGDPVKTNVIDVGFQIVERQSA